MQVVQEGDGRTGCPSAPQGWQPSHLEWVSFGVAWPRTRVRMLSVALLALAVTSANASEAAGSRKPDVRRFAGSEGGLGKFLGLEDDWAIRAVRARGNYAEIYERNVGVKLRLGIPRGLNQLWNMGGILYAPPLR